MMFVDESGDPGYPPDGNWANFGGSKLFCRVGVIIHGWKWKAWQSRFMHFKNINGLLWNDEIKASHIQRGKGIFSGWHSARRELFISDYSSLIGFNADITLIGIVIDKRRVDTLQRDRLVKPQLRSMEFLLERYNYFLNEQSDKSGIVVLDPTLEKNDDNIRYFQAYLQENSDHLQPLHIVESTFFAKSHTSSMIQISDFCTHIFYKQFLTGGFHRPYNSIYRRFWRKGSRIKGYGIKMWPE
jgi:hypothetical protein